MYKHDHEEINEEIDKDSDDEDEHEITGKNGEVNKDDVNSD